ncbi:uracil-DNA glycosylase-like protein [Mycena amicta]|nr:uracil-DNA glycosylase-like protein [Mycena amicta]
MDSDNDSASQTILRFRNSLSHFSFATPSTTQARVDSTSARRNIPETPSPKKRQKRSYAPPKKRKKRSYAPPETYANLHPVNDYLRADLDVVFCGINPGVKSAATGHHYGSPSNHFWWCLHNAGFTDTQLSPEEDWTLPDRFSLGLTNLVDRPTAEHTELSAAEQLESVPVLLAKTASYRPCLVVFVGIGIARAVETKLGVTHNGSQSWGIRSYKMVHATPSAFAETIFFAAPSTSGLVTHFQRPEKARIMGEARRLVDDLKAGRVSTVHMSVIQPHQIAQAPHLDLDSPSLLKLSPTVKEEEDEKQ